MNKENAIKQIRENLKRLLRFADEKFGTLVLSDGTNISISSQELEIGAEVFMLDDLGNQTPCDNGDYVLQDGRTFTVTDGKISDIKQTEAGEEKPASGDTTTEKPETMASEGLPEGHEVAKEEEEPIAEEMDDQIGMRVGALEKSVAEILNILSKMGDSQNELNEQMMASIKKFGAEPGDEPIKSVKKGFDIYGSKKAVQTQEAFNELKQLMKQRRKMS